MFSSPNSPNKEGKNRAIDEKVAQTTRSLKSKFVLVPSMEVKVWKAFIIIMFAAGFFAALVWSAYNKWYVGSGASSGKAVMEARENCKKHQKGDQFQSSIILDTDGSAVFVAYAIATFDKNAVEVLSVDTSASDFKYEIKKEVDPLNGKIVIALGQKSPGANSSSARIAAVNLKALQDLKGTSLALKFDSKEAKVDSAAISSNGLNALEKVKSSAANDECGGVPLVPPVPPTNCGDGKCKGGETCSSCEKDCGVCAQEDPRAPMIIIKNSTRQLSSDQPLYTTSKRIDFKGKLPELSRGKVRIFRNGKLKKIVKAKPSGAWRKKMDMEKNGTFSFQFKYYDRAGKEIYASEKYLIVKKK